MALSVSCLYSLAVIASALVGVYGHGRMLLPPSRPSAWRLGFSTPRDYNDVGLNCGGVTNQWDVQGGKCGICGDPWQDTPPRDHERPDGIYVSKTNFILSSYNQGERVTVSVELSASHMGYFEFYICNVDKVPGQVEATQDCLNKYPLNLVSGGTRFPADQGSTKYSPVVILPADLTCNHCVIQWKYHVGNSYGCFSNGTCCTGCGLKQEEFYSCADIEIRSSDGSLPTTLKPPSTTTTTATTTTTTTTSTTKKPTITTTTPPPSTSPFWFWQWWKTTTNTPTTTTTTTTTTTSPIDYNQLSEWDKMFYTCNYCHRECYINKRCPGFCNELGLPRACPRSLSFLP